MSPSWLPGQPCRGGMGAGPDEIETLQTDVMRFMAILGFCLMIIFALVQALPVLPQNIQPQLLDREHLGQEASQLKQHVDRLRTRLALLQTGIRDSLKKKHAIGEKLKAVHRKLAITLRLLRETRASLHENARQLESIKRDLAEQSGSLIEIRKRLDARKREAERAELRLDLARQSLSRLNLPPEKERPGSSQQAKIDPAPGGIGRGFSLGFRTEAALKTLIVSGRVAFYAIVGARAWRLELDGRGAAYRSAPMPRSFYEMTPETVPLEFVAALKQVVSVFDDSAVVWAVTLPGSTRRDIGKLMKEYQGGRLLIEADGAVHLEVPES